MKLVKSGICDKFVEKWWKRLKKNLLEFCGKSCDGFYLSESYNKFCGVESASFVGSDKHQIALTGERIDPIELTKLLKKGVGHTELVSVGSVEETAPAPPASATASQAPIVAPQVHYPYYYNYGVPYHIYQGPYNNDPACSIM
ncbi:hypothetical protein Hanom_Chr11g00980081 [Helianthus anomalus]